MFKNPYSQHTVVFVERASPTDACQDPCPNATFSVAPGAVQAVPLSSLGYYFAYTTGPTLNSLDWYQGDPALYWALPPDGTLAPFSVPGDKLTAAQLATQLPVTADGYLFPSETDVSLRFLAGPPASAVTSAQVLADFAAAHDAQATSMFGTSSCTPLASKYVREVDAAAFFTQYAVPYDPSDPYIVGNCKKFASVVDLLKANLTDIHVYRFTEGDPSNNIQAPGQVSIFIAGLDAAGELVAVMTGAVQT